MFRKEPAQAAAPPLAEIRQSFEESAADEEHFPSSIDPRILHVRAVMDAMNGAQRVLDLGCGKGRFARLVKDANPKAQVVAFDLAVSMLRVASTDLDRCAGSMLELPFPDGVFDGLYATESLEHAVDIEKAIAELCRVVRPDGKIVIIDKNAEHWGKLKTPAWEKWFRAKELEKLLRRYSREASSAPISYWEGERPDGLFLCWRAVK